MRNQYYAAEREEAWKKLKPSVVFGNTGNESKAESLRQDFPKLLQDQPQCQGAEFFSNSDLFSHLDLQNYSYPRIILYQGKQLAQDATS